MIRLFYWLILGCLPGIPFTAAAQFCAPLAVSDIFPASTAVARTSGVSSYSLKNASSILSADLYIAGWTGTSQSSFSWRLCDQANPTLVYNQGTFPYSNVQDLEVGLTNTPSGVTTIYVAYYRNGAGHFVDEYRLFSTTVAFVSTRQLSNAASYGRIRIDSHGASVNAITWHYPGLGIQAVAVNMGSFGSVIDLVGTYFESDPDLAFSHSSGPLNVHFIYHDKAAGTITESVVPWDSLYYSSLPRTPWIEDVNYVGSSASLRAVLDCPDHFATENWAYTYTTNNSDIMMRLVDYLSIGAPITVDLTNGMTGMPPIIGTYVSTSPCISYNDGSLGDFIHVGWYVNDGANAQYVDARLEPDGTTLSACYTWLPASVTGTVYPYRPGVAYSKAGDVGTVSPDLLYAVYYDLQSGSMKLHHAYHVWGSSFGFKGSYHRYHPECGSNRKTANQMATTMPEVHVYPNPATTEVYARIESVSGGSASLQLTDITGRMVAGTDEGIGTGSQQLKLDGLGQLPSGIYHLTVLLNGSVIGQQRITRL